MRPTQMTYFANALIGAGMAACMLAGCESWSRSSAPAGTPSSAVAGGGINSGRVGSSAWDGEYGDIRTANSRSTPNASNPGSAAASNSGSAPSDSPASSGTRSGAANAALPSLADEETRRARREVERVASLTRMTELVPNLKAPDWITAGKVVKGDQTILPAAGMGNSLKDAYDAAVVSGQRELLKQAGIPATRVVIGRSAYQRLNDGQWTWQVFVEAVGVGGTGPLPILARPAPTDKPPVDLVGE